MIGPVDPRSLEIADLVRRAVSGDRAAWDMLLQCLEPTIKSAVRRALTGRFQGEFDDVVQNARLQVFTKLSEWRGVGLFSYVYTLSYRLAIDLTRQKLSKRERSVRLSHGPLPEASTSLSVPEQVDQKERIERVRQAAENIRDPILRRVLELRLLDQTFSEIGSAFDRSEAWARVAWNQVQDELLKQIRALPS